MSSVTESIKAFLLENTHPDLATIYTPDMEVQVNVTAGDGESVPGRRNTYTNGVERWYNFRIPKNAREEPHFDDYPLRFSLSSHAEAIGMTGWDWKNRRSRWVAFDFDDITEHASGIGISDEELKHVRTAAKAIPWVTVRQSTGGRGLHLYVFFADPPETANHTEHAALGRAVLAKMSLVANFDFNAKVDACGGNMWVWHRKMIGLDGEKIGLHLQKEGEPLTELPTDWKFHLDVVRNRRSKIRVAGIAENEEDAFEKLATSRPSVKIDDDHRKLINWISSNGHTCDWNQDHRLLITHTAALKEAHEALSLKGVFDTLATGRQKGDHNCFCFPVLNGAWAVYRYSPGTAEASSWQRSEQGWTYCYLNQASDLKAAANSFGGIKAPDGSYVLESADNAKKVLKALGVDLNLPTWIAHREISLKMQNGELVAQIPHENSDDTQNMRQEGWLKRGKNWVKVYEIEKSIPQEDQANATAFDDRIRHLVTPTMEDAGWVLRDAKGRLIEEPKTNIKSVLKSWGLSDKDTEAALGHLITNPWDLVNLPFQEEFPGDRRWNRDAAKLAVTPTEEDREMVHPHWNRIFEHCGEGLDEAVTKNKWCVQNGIRSGADYLRLWAAILFQKPTHPLPYLFFFSERQNTGKSTFHQSLGLLM